MSGHDSLRSSLPLCTEGILNRKTIVVTPWGALNENIPLKEHDCRLHLYNKKDMVTCVEALKSIAMDSNTLRNQPTVRDRFKLTSGISFISRNTSNPSIKFQIYSDGTDQETLFRMNFIGDSRIHQIYMNFMLQVNSISCKKNNFYNFSFLVTIFNFALTHMRCTDGAIFRG